MTQFTPETHSGPNRAGDALALWRNIAAARWARAHYQQDISFAAITNLRHIECAGATPALRRSATSAIDSLDLSIQVMTLARSWADAKVRVGDQLRSLPGGPERLIERGFDRATGDEWKDLFDDADEAARALFAQRQARAASAIMAVARALGLGASRGGDALVLWRNITAARWAVAHHEWASVETALHTLRLIEGVAITPALRRSATSAIDRLGREISRAEPNAVGKPKQDLLP